MKILLTSMLLATGSAAAAGTIYSQPVTDPNTAYASQNDTGLYGNFATASDDFTLGSSATINGVSWVGSYYSGSPGGITAFTLTFSSDAGGTPGTALYSTTISGNAGESLTGAYSSYSAPVSFAAVAGTTYWLSIVPDLVFPPQWGWAIGSGGNGTAYQVFFGSGAPLASDLAFSLQGAVPEPASWALMVAGFGLAGAALRRRRLQPA